MPRVAPFAFSHPIHPTRPAVAGLDRHFAQRHPLGLNS